MYFVNICYFKGIFQRRFLQINIIHKGGIAYKNAFEGNIISFGEIFFYFKYYSRFCQYYHYQYHFPRFSDFFNFLLRSKDGPFCAFLRISFFSFKNQVSLTFFQWYCFLCQYHFQKSFFPK